jgi:hypothetical protein
MTREHAPAERIALYLPRDRADAGPFEAQADPTDAGEQFTDPHDAPP